MSNWRLINSAPRDGTQVLLYLPKAEKYMQRQIGAFSFNGEETGDEGYWWDQEANYYFDPEPTHWQVLDDVPFTGENT